MTRHKAYRGKADQLKIHFRIDTILGLVRRMRIEWSNREICDKVSAGIANGGADNGLLANLSEAADKVEQSEHGVQKPSSWVQSPFSPRSSTPLTT